MRRLCLVVVVATLLGPWLASRALAFAMEEKGNEPRSEKNYTEWKGIMPVVNDKARVYLSWANGNERLYFKGATEELNEALAHFAQVEVQHHVVALRPGPAIGQCFDKTEISYNWELHILGGLARRYANDNIEDLEWQKDPVLTIYVGGQIDLDKLKIPKGVTLRAAAAQGDQATSSAAALQRIKDFLEARKPQDQN
jgi:hypothetical protein